MQSLNREKCPRCGRPVCQEAEWICPACISVPESLSDPFRIGPYEIVETLGRGGMGIVHRVRHMTQHRDAALKLMLNPLFGGTAARRRFEFETAALASLDHPGILPLYESGETDEGTLWYSMKLASGDNLRKKQDSLRGCWRQCAELVETIANAVDYAHRNGIIHRDLKPGNIVFDDKGRPYVADFGIAARSTRENQDLTVSGGLMGVPVYCAPEVLSQGAKYATTASDIYALGVILYELLTGRLPFNGETESALLAELAHAPAVPPRLINPLIPRDLGAIALKALTYEPGRRYSTAGSMAADLRAWLEARPVEARSVYLWERVRLWVRRSPLAAGLAALLVSSLTVYGITLFSALRRATKGEQIAEDQVAYLTVALPDLLEPIAKLYLLEAPYARVAEYYAAQSLSDSTTSGLENRIDFYIRWSIVKGKLGNREEKLRLAKLAADAAAFMEESRKEEMTPRGYYLAERAHRGCANGLRDFARTGDAERALQKARDAAAAGTARFPGDPFVILSSLELAGENQERLAAAGEYRTLAALAPPLELTWLELVGREPFRLEAAIQKYARNGYTQFMARWATAARRAGATEECRAILHRRVATVNGWRSPGNGMMEILYAESCEWLGLDYTHEEVNLEKAAYWLGERVAITQRLWEGDRYNVWYLQHLSNAFANMAKLARMKGDLPQENADLRESLKHLDAIAASDPSPNPELMRARSTHLWRLGQNLLHYQHQGNALKALECFKMAIPERVEYLKFASDSWAEHNTFALLVGDLERELLLAGSLVSPREAEDLLNDGIQGFYARRPANLLQPAGTVWAWSEAALLRSLAAIQTMGRRSGAAAGNAAAAWNLLLPLLDGPLVTAKAARAHLMDPVNALTGSGGVDVPTLTRLLTALLDASDKAASLDGDLEWRAKWGNAVRKASEIPGYSLPRPLAVRALAVLYAGDSAGEDVDAAALRRIAEPPFP